MFGYITMLRGSPVFNDFYAVITDTVESILKIHIEKGKEGGGVRLDSENFVNFAYVVKQDMRP